MPPLNLTKAELEVYKEIQRVRMAWVALIVGLLLFAVCLAGLLVTAYSGKGEAWLKVGVAVMNGVLGTCVTRAYFYLFPKRAVQKN